MGKALKEPCFIDWRLDGSITSSKAFDERLEHVDATVEAILDHFDQASGTLLKHLDGLEVLDLQACVAEQLERWTGGGSERIGVSARRKTIGRPCYDQADIEQLGERGWVGEVIALAGFCVVSDGGVFGSDAAVADVKVAKGGSDFSGLKHGSYCVVPVLPRWRGGGHCG